MMNLFSLIPFRKQKLPEAIQRMKEWLISMGHGNLALLVEDQHSVMQELRSAFDALNIDHCFLGDTVLPFYNYPVTTDCVGVLVSRDQERTVENVLKKNYMRSGQLPDGTVRWYWQKTPVAVGFVFSGRKYRKNGLKFPEPNLISVDQLGFKMITLPRLIMHKLDSARHPLREKDIGHVDALIKANRLSKTYARDNQFPAVLQRDFEKRWNLLQKYQREI